MNIQNMAKIYNEQEDLNRLARSIYSSLSPREKSDIQDQMFFESMEIEKFYRQNKRACDRINSIMAVKKYGNKSLVNEAFLYDFTSLGFGTEIAIDAVIAAAPAIGAATGPGYAVGAAVSGAGAIYYLIRASNAWSRGEKFTAFMELTGAIGAAMALAPGQGTAASGAMMIFKNALKAAFKNTKVWKYLGKMFKFLGYGGTTPAPLPSDANFKKIREGFRWFRKKMDEIAEFFSDPKIVDEMNKLDPGAAENAGRMLDASKEAIPAFENTTEVLIKSTTDPAGAAELAKKYADDIADVAEIAGEQTVAAEARALSLATKGGKGTRMVINNLDEGVLALENLLKSSSSEFKTIINDYLTNNQATVKTALGNIFNSQEGRNGLRKYVSDMLNDSTVSLTTAMENTFKRIKTEMTSSSVLSVQTVIFDISRGKFDLRLVLKIQPPGITEKFSLTQISKILGDDFYKAMDEILPYDELAKSIQGKLRNLDFSAINLNVDGFFTTTGLEALTNELKKAAKVWTKQYAKDKRWYRFLQIASERALTYIVRGSESTTGEKMSAAVGTESDPDATSRDRIEENAYLEKLILISESRKRRIRSQKLINLLKNS